MHYLNKQAKVRDVLDARNYVARTIINAGNQVIGVIIAAAFWLYAHIVHIEHWYLWVLFISAYFYMSHTVKIKPSPDLEETEKTVNETPYEGDSIIDY